MKKIYSALTLLFAVSALHAQVQQGKTLQPIGGTIQGQDLPATSFVTPPGSGTYTHSCKSHDFTEQHYIDQGYDYNQMVTDDHHFISTEQAAGPNKTPGTNTISVIFHVVYNNASENVSNALIMQVYNDLVEDFQLLNSDASGARTAFGFIPADANINFCLATQTPAGVPLTEQGVIRVSTTETFYDSDNGEENKMKSAVTGGSTIWNRNNYLNIWICDISNGASSGTAGYAYRPVGGVLPGSTIDGIVLDYNLGMNNENVLTHEVGHYLGLDHTWGGSGSCALDDGFADTPNTQGPSFNFAGSCSGNQTTCGATQTQYENYMDYANCTCMFTANQVTHMTTVLTGIRGSLLLSPGCDPTSTPPNSAFTADIASPIIIPVNATVNLIDQSTNVPTGWAWVISGTAGVNWNYVGGTTAASQNPSVTFLTVGTYNVTLTASNGFGTDPTPAVQTAYIQVVAPAAGTGCDTLRNWDPADADANGYYYYNAPAGGWGAYPGHADLDGSNWYSYQYAEQFVYGGTAEVRRVRMPFFIAYGTGAATIELHVYANAAGAPGAVLATEVIDIADINEGYWNEFDFTTPASVTGTFWVGYEMFYGAGQDTVLVGMTNTIAGGVDSYYIDLDGNGWTSGTLLGITGSIAMDVLLSNGPAPVADMDFSESEVCPGGQIVVNGAGSTNTTNYYWYQTDEPVTTIIDDSYNGGATFTFPGPAGDYNIFLFADGSCLTDGLVLPVVVNPAVTASAVVTNTTCGINNGSIVVTAGGGDGVYEYKLNSGGWQTSNTFTNLSSGSYTVYVRTGGDNCEISFVANVGASTPLAATVSLNTDICPGGNANITAGGGGTYSWTNGGTVIGTTATINVVPTVTTIYTCTVTTGGCQALVSTTVTVDPLDDAYFDFFDFCFGSSNSAVSITTPGGAFAFNPLPGDGATINSSTGEISNEVVGTTYSVQYTTAANCTNTSVQTVFVNTQDDPQFTTGNYCSGGTNTVSGIATPGGIFTYNGTDASSINSGTGVITGGVAGTTYQIIYTTPPGVCSAVSSPVSVTVNTTPTVSAVGNQTVCDGANFSGITFSGTGGATFNWTNTNSTIGLSASGAGNISGFTASGTTPGGSAVSGTITTTPVLGTCTGSSVNFTLTVNSLPAVDAGLDQTICVGSSVTLSGGGAVSYTWDNGVTDGAAFTPGVGTVTYTVTGTGANTCQNTDAVVVTVNNVDDASFVSTDICEGDINIVSSVVTPGGVFTYDGADGSSIDPSTGIISNGVAGTIYNVTYTTPASACQAVSTPFAVEVFANPDGTGVVTNDDGTTNGAIDITPTGGSAPYGFAWDHGPSSEDVTGLAAGSYGVTITDANGCSSYESFTVISIVGIETNPLDAELTIYPNPTNGMINVQLYGDFNVVIRDSRGRIVTEKSGNNNLIIDMNSLESAVYFVTVQQGDNVVVRRVVKQ